MARAPRCPPESRSRAARRFVAGVALGFCVYVLVLLLTSLLVAPIHFTRLTTLDASSIFLVIGSYLALAVMEELGFRGYPLRTLVSAIGPWHAQAVVAAAFCLSHVAFGWPWEVVALGVLPGAILFGVAALAGGDLGMPIGVHAAMNVARWMAGQTDTPGIWKVAVEQSAHGRVAAFAPLVGFAVTVMCAAALSFWHFRHSSFRQTPATR